VPQAAGATRAADKFNMKSRKMAPKPHAAATALLRLECGDRMLARSHSSRSTMAGSTRVARRAGKYAARVEMATRNTARTA